jgi:hypothetical protein
MGQGFKSLVCDDQDVGVKVESTLGCLAGNVAVCEMFVTGWSSSIDMHVVAVHNYSNPQSMLTLEAEDKQ